MEETLGPGQEKTRVGKVQGHPPDDLVALVAHRSLAIAATAPSCASSSSCLHDGGAVLQRRGCGRLAVPGQHRARLVRGVALSKRRVHSPGWAAGGAGGGRACQSQGKRLHGVPRDPKRQGIEPRAAWRGPPSPCPWRLPTLPQAPAHSLSPGQGSWGVAEAGTGASVLGTWLQDLPFKALYGWAS